MFVNESGQLCPRVRLSRIMGADVRLDPAGSTSVIRPKVAEQEQELGVFFDTIVVCSVTGSTQAGIVAGFALQDAERKVLGVDGSARVEQTSTIDLVRSGRISPGSRVFFAHLGGQPALNPLFRCLRKF